MLRHIFRAHLQVLSVILLGLLVLPSAISARPTMIVTQSGNGIHWASHRDIARPQPGPARTSQPGPNLSAENQALEILIALTALFVLFSAVAMTGLAIFVRRYFWAKAADGPDIGWRTYLMQLPLGAPEGSVRALLSIYIIIFGLLVLVMQRRLGLVNVEAITGFLGMVIAFYFTSRSNDQAHRAVATAARHAMAAADAANRVAGAVANQANNAQPAPSDAASPPPDVTSAPDATLAPKPGA